MTSGIGGLVLRCVTKQIRPASDAMKSHRCGDECTVTASTCEALKLKPGCIETFSEWKLYAHAAVNPAAISRLNVAASVDALLQFGEAG